MWDYSHYLQQILKVRLLTSSVHKHKRRRRETENEEEESKWVLKVRMRCFPYECKALKRTETDFSVQRRYRMVWCDGGEEKNKRWWVRECVWACAYVIALSLCLSHTHTHTHARAHTYTHTHIHKSICTLRTSQIINEILEMRAYQAGINHWGLLSRRMAPCGDKRQADVWGGLGREERRRRGVEGKGWNRSLERAGKRGEYWWGKV